MTFMCGKADKPAYMRYPQCRCLRCRAWALACAIEERKTVDLRAEFLTHWLTSNIRVGGLRKRPLREHL